ncbi:MAG: 16S rRNA (uracil(1498)-N(3))-methyltransferase, partial [Burkholderiaceae bacterium]
MPRLFCPEPLHSGLSLGLPPGAARHVQVLRLQPGDAITLFDGRGGEHEATITRMGRSTVDVQVGTHHAVEREAPIHVHLALGIPANERMDWLVEKATELGVAGITPLMSARSVLRLSGERAEKKQAHWQSIAVAACEQCGRNRVPPVATPVAFDAWLRGATAHLVQHPRPPPLPAPPCGWCCRSLAMRCPCLLCLNRFKPRRLTSASS